VLFACLQLMRRLDDVPLFFENSKNLMEVRSELGEFVNEYEHASY
jgi:hypothetical protein